jgi:putative transposase
MQMRVWLGASKSGYYEWESPPAKRHGGTAATAQAQDQIQALFEANDQAYRYRRLHASLVRGGEQAGPELVRQLMRELGPMRCQPWPRRRCMTEQAAASPIPDLVNRDFTAAKPGEKMVGDITCMFTWEGWLYLATVIDCATGKVAGRAMADNYQTPLISEAITMAARNLDLSEGAIFHREPFRITIGHVG